jgi:hypothetical protein
MPERTDAELFAQLREMWDRTDPMPSGLVEDVLVAIGTARLPEEYSELLLVSDELSLPGVRGAAPRIVQFGVEAVTLLLRIDDSGDARRVDGWLAPPRAGEVALEVDGVEVAATNIGADGRFELSPTASGTARLVIRLAGEDGYTVTGDFEL